MFDSTIGRWQSKDPKSFDAGDTNLYRFVGNHSSYASDPSGLAERELNGYNFVGSGQHKIPFTVIETELGFLTSHELLADLDGFTIAQPSGTGHRFTFHGESGYNGAVRGLVRDVISDFKSRNGLLAVDMVPDALHADLVSELKSAIDSQPSDTLISRFNASVEFGGDAAVRELRSSWGSQGQSRRYFNRTTQRGGFIRLPSRGLPIRAMLTEIATSPAVELALEGGIALSTPYMVENDVDIGRAIAGLASPGQIVFQIDWSNAVLMNSFDANQRRTERKQDEWIIPYLIGEGNGVDPKIVRRRARAFMDAQMHYRDMLGQLPANSSQEYNQARDLDKVESLYWQIVVPEKFVK